MGLIEMCWYVVLMDAIEALQYRRREWSISMLNVE